MGKHLAPYLPYKINIWDSVAKKQKVMNMGQGVSGNWVGIKTVLSYSASGSFIYMPILRPLANLPNQKDCENELYEKCSNMSIDMNLDYVCEFKGDIYKTLLSYRAVTILIMWGFDVFGLIEKGLAKNILEL